MTNAVGVESFLAQIRSILPDENAADEVPLDVRTGNRRGSVQPLKRIDSDGQICQIGVSQDGALARHDLISQTEEGDLLVGLRSGSRAVLEKAEQIAAGETIRCSGAAGYEDGGEPSA